MFCLANATLIHQRKTKLCIKVTSGRSLDLIPVCFPFREGNTFSYWDLYQLFFSFSFTSAPSNLQQPIFRHKVLAPKKTSIS